MEACEKTEKSVGWKVYFSGEEDDQDFVKSKLYVKSTNQPLVPPPQISLRMSNFVIQLRKLFSHHPRLKSKLSKFQEKLFNRLRRDGNIVFASADKNLGPVAVTILKYIKDALVHLKNEDTYLIVSEEETLLEDADLRS